MVSKALVAAARIPPASEMERDAMTGYYFVVEEGIAREKPIPVRAMVAIGRDPENDIRLSDRSVSKRHALVCLIGGEYVIQDLGSLNGIFINGERVKTAVLHSGDTLKLGHAILRFIYKAESGGAETGS
jgi:pSer/pThr/pTyr-binding forkhead associated (FHA) protein